MIYTFVNMLVNSLTNLSYDYGRLFEVLFKYQAITHLPPFYNNVYIQFKNHQHHHHSLKRSGIKNGQIDNGNNDFIRINKN
jgi:hypothetical protein